MISEEQARILKISNHSAEWQDGPKANESPVPPYSPLAALAITNARMGNSTLVTDTPANELGQTIGIVSRMAQVLDEINPTIVKVRGVPDRIAAKDGEIMLKSINHGDKRKLVIVENMVDMIGSGPLAPTPAQSVSIAALQYIVQNKRTDDEERHRLPNVVAFTSEIPDLEQQHDERAALLESMLIQPYDRVVVSPPAARVAQPQMQ